MRSTCPVCVPGGDGEFFFPLQGWHVEFAAQRRGGEGHRRFTDKVEAAPFKTGMWFHMDHQQQVAGLRSPQSGIAFAAQADA